MIVLSNTTAQTLTPGQAITFNDIILHSGCGECHRANTSSVKLRANGIYEVNFGANVSSPTGGIPVKLNISVGDDPLLETTMISTPSLPNVFNHVSVTTAVKNCCGDFDRLTVINTGTTAMTIGANSVLFIKRLS